MQSKQLSSSFDLGQTLQHQLPSSLCVRRFEIGAPYVGKKSVLIVAGQLHLDDHRVFVFVGLGGLALLFFVAHSAGYKRSLWHHFILSLKGQHFAVVFRYYTSERDGYYTGRNSGVNDYFGSTALLNGAAACQKLYNKQYECNN